MLFAKSTALTKNKTMRLLFAFVLGIFILSACNSSSTAKEQTTKQETEVEGVHHVTIKEVVHASAYSYFLVSEDGVEDYWMAVSKIDLKVGADFYFEEGLEMIDFESKELNRTFEKVLFVQMISDVPINSKLVREMSGTQDHGMPEPKNSEKEIKVEVPEGAITIAELYKNKEDYNGKKVLVHGEVVKVNNGIMSKNWIHIQDGTKHETDFDLTITTQEEITVGSVLTFEGIVTLDKDFGAGYVYALIIEDGTVK